MAFQRFTGKEYLKIDIANNYGLDKENWDVRIAWFDENEHQLDVLLKSAEEPALFWAGVCAWRDVKAGKPSGYPISLDATSSGIQLLACLTGDRKAATLCNVVDSGNREDAYTGLYNSMLTRIGEDAKITRDDTKSAIMTAFYSSTAVPKRIFGEGKLLDIFYETMKEEAPGPWEVNETMLAIWNPTVLVNEWVMPDNFHVRIKVMGTDTDMVHFLNEPFEVTVTVNKPIEGGRSLGANTVHSLDGMVVRELVRRCDHDPVKVNQIRKWLKECRGGTSRTRPEDQMVMTLAELYEDSGFFSARLLSYVDAANMGHLSKEGIQCLQELVDSLPEKPFQVLAVHDCFRVLPNYGNDIRYQYNRILAEIAKSNILSFMVSQIVGRFVSVTKIDSHFHEDILEANYALS